MPVHSYEMDALFPYRAHREFGWGRQQPRRREHCRHEVCCHVQYDVGHKVSTTMNFCWLYF